MLISSSEPGLPQDVCEPGAHLRANRAKSRLSRDRRAMSQASPCQDHKVSRPHAAEALATAPHVKDEKESLSPRHGGGRFQSHVHRKASRSAEPRSAVVTAVRTLRGVQSGGRAGCSVSHWEQGAASSEPHSVCQLKRKGFNSDTDRQMRVAPAVLKLQRTEHKQL